MNSLFIFLAHFSSKLNALFSLFINSFYIGAVNHLRQLISFPNLFSYVLTAGYLFIATFKCGFEFLFIGRNNLIYSQFMDNTSSVKDKS